MGPKKRSQPINQKHSTYPIIIYNSALSRVSKENSTELHSMSVATYRIYKNILYILSVLPKFK